MDEGVVIVSKGVALDLLTALTDVEELYAAYQALAKSEVSKVYEVKRYVTAQLFDGINEALSGTYIVDNALMEMEGQRDVALDRVAALEGR